MRLGRPKWMAGTSRPGGLFDIDFGHDATRHDPTRTKPVMVLCAVRACRRNPQALGSCAAAPVTRRSALRGRRQRGGQRSSTSNSTATGGLPGPLKQRIECLSVIGWGVMKMMDGMVNDDW